VHYLVTEVYTPEAEGGVRWDDPAFGIEWPDPANAFLSPKDAAWPDFDG
jgi:dTDP-4-dehydrorhamnose 3,5-epimerase